MIAHWAILSGIEGNLRALEAVLRDLQRQRPPHYDALCPRGHYWS